LSKDTYEHFVNNLKHEPNINLTSDTVITTKNSLQDYFDGITTFDKYVYDKVYANNPFNLSDNNIPMAHIQLFTNSAVEDFKDKLGIEGDVWFFHVDFDTSYGHAIPTIQNMITRNVLKA